MGTSRLTTLATMLLLTALLVACADDDSTAGTGGATTTPQGCGGCGDGQSCCESWDQYHCVSTDLHVEHCGACNTPCSNGEVCENGSCDTGTTCSMSDAGACTTGDCCLDVCCLEGTRCYANPSTFHGCCPEGEACGCVGNDCPVSRRATKRDIVYLDRVDLDSYRSELLELRLARYRYRHDAQGRPRLGFIIEDVEPSVAVDSERGVVDLYGYTSMAIATLQSQAKEIAELRKEVAELRDRLPK